MRIIYGNYMHAHGIYNNELLSLAQPALLSMETEARAVGAYILETNQHAKEATQ